MDTGRLQTLEGYRVKEDILRKWQGAERGKRSIPSATYLQDGNPPQVFSQRKRMEISEKRREKDRERESPALILSKKKLKITMTLL